MKNYIVEWFPKRGFRGIDISVKNDKWLYFFGFGWTLLSCITGILPLFGIGTIGFASWFNLGISIPLLYCYIWLLLRIKKNDLGNGVPEKW